MNSKLIRILGSLLLCFMFFGTYLDARRGRGRGRGRGGRCRRSYRHRGWRRPYRHHRYRGWGHHGYGYGWGWPGLWFTIGATRSDRPKKDPLKAERDQAINAISNYENMLDTLEAAVVFLKRGMSYYLPIAAMQPLYYQTERTINDYAHQLNILDLKLDLLTNRINSLTDSGKSVEKTLNDILLMARRHQEKMVALKAEVDLLTQEASSLNLKHEELIKQNLEQIRQSTEDHANKIKNFKKDIKQLTNRL